ncbi:MAG: hypothetical protein HY291_04565 [Planctomycetes bacterium]|nr:hypothetical protein [Planctomycetota bacterium]
MKPPKVPRHALGLFCAVFFSAAIAGAEDAPPKQGMDDAQKELGELIQIEILNGRIALVRKNWADAEQAPPHGADDKYTKAQFLFDRFLSKLYDPMAKGQFMLISELDKTGDVARAECQQTFAIGTMQYYGHSDRFYFKFTEKVGAKRTLLVDDNDPDAGLLLQIDQSPLDSYTRIQQCADGTLILLSRKGNDRVRLMGDNLDALLKSEPGRVQVLFLRAFTDLGVQVAPYKFLPTAMAGAASGFGAAAPEHAKKADELIAKLNSEDAAEREGATADLIRHFPRAVKHIKDIAAKTENAEVKARLAKVVAAHHGIAKILPWVEQQKLHEDRAYLLDMLATVPFFKASARARLAELCGKDYGDDPAAWPKP